MIFGRNDLVQDAPISRIDLLVSRNALMYFTAETQSRILSHFNFALREDGFLFLGKSEMLITHTDLFVPHDLKWRVFQKVPQGGLRARLSFVGGGPLRVEDAATGRDPARGSARGVAAGAARGGQGGARRLGERPRARAVRLGRQCPRPAVPGPGGLLPPRRAARGQSRTPTTRRPRSSSGHVPWETDGQRLVLDVVDQPVPRRGRRGGGRGDRIRGRDRADAARRRAPRGEGPARDRLRRAPVDGRGAGDDERGAPLDQRGAGDHQRGAPVDQRGARDDERGARVHQPRARDDERRAELPLVGARSSELVSRGCAGEPGGRGRRGRQPTCGCSPGTARARSCGACAPARRRATTSSASTSGFPWTSSAPR